jgi:hypothetical protein
MKKLFEKISIIIMLISGFACITLGIGFYYKNENFKKNAIRTQGTIVELKERKRAYIPIFVFYDINNNQVKVTARISTSPPIGRVGDSVKVIYHKDNPSGAKIELFWLALLPLFAFGGFGLFLVVASISVMKGWGKATFDVKVNEKNIE